MLPHGYNKSDLAPYRYEADAFSTTNALHCEVARVSNRACADGDSVTSKRGVVDPAAGTGGADRIENAPVERNIFNMKRCAVNPAPSTTVLEKPARPAPAGRPPEPPDHPNFMTETLIRWNSWLGRLRVKITHTRL